VNLLEAMPVVVLGDFNASCDAGTPESMGAAASLELVVDGDIDCIFSRQGPGAGMGLTRPLRVTRRSSLN
jgi:hypothetical protein